MLARLAAGERHDPPAARRGRLCDLGVGRRVARSARRLEGEGAGARDAARLHRPEQRGEVEAGSVGGVDPEMHVHVDEALLRHQRPHVRAPHALERCGGFGEGGGHGAGC